MGGLFIKLKVWLWDKDSGELPREWKLIVREDEAGETAK